VGGSGWKMHPLLDAVPKDNVTPASGIHSGTSDFFLSCHNRIVIICLKHLHKTKKKKLNLSVSKDCLAKLMQDSTIKLVYIF
jgi:hypothetical protein